MFFSVVGAAGSVREMLATAPVLFLFSLVQARSAAQPLRRLRTPDGILFHLIVFRADGLSADVFVSVRGHTQVAVHLGFVLAVGPRFGFTRPEILLASNANVGGAWFRCCDHCRHRVSHWLTLHVEARSVNAHFACSDSILGA